MKYQNAFIELLNTAVPSHVSVADSLSKLLNISKDSAYRRLRNDTPFSLDEAALLCAHFQLSLDTLYQSDSHVRFTHNLLYEHESGFLEYLQRIEDTLTAVHQYKGKITFAAEDVPMFLHFAYPHLTCFKLFYWSKAVLGSGMYEDKTFNPELVNPEIRNKAKSILAIYDKIDSVEIWTTESINSTLRQILYYVESYQFESQKDALAVLDELVQVIEDLEKKAINSAKDLENADSQNYVLFDSEVLIGNNTVMIEGLPKPLVFLSHNTFNTIATTDQGFYQDTKRWIDNLISKSNMISGVSEKMRLSFFKKIQHSIALTRKKVESFYL